MLTDNLQESDLRQIVKKQEARLTVIISVQQALAANMDMQGIYELVGDRIRELFDAQVTMICTFDYENKAEHFQYIVENGIRLYSEPRLLDKVRQQIISTQKLINIEENVTGVLKTIRGETPKADSGARLPKSVLFVPLIAGNTVRGYVHLQNLDHEHAFNEPDVRFLNSFANSMSITTQNTGALKKLRKAMNDLRSAQEQLVQHEKLASLRQLTAGIAHEMKKKKLQPFFTTKKGKEGTGLGLSITNDIVKAHGGALRIDSRENEFTRFNINITEI